MENLKLYPYTMGSEAAKDLADILEITRVREDGNYRPKMGHVVVNFGNSASPVWADLAVARGVRILNRPSVVSIVSNKLKTLQVLQAAGIRVPAFTTSFTEAKNWFDQGYAIVERHKLTGSGGEGIRIAYLEGGQNTNQTLTNAPLYTKYLFKEKEFRVHVFRGQVIDYIQKKKRTNAEQMPNFNRFIYSANLGWVFVRETAEHLDSVKNLAIQAVRGLGLDFGAVDIVVVDGIPFVLEVNTAPGLQGTTLVKYANAIRQFMGAGPVSQDMVNKYVTGREVIEPVTPAATRAQDGIVAQDLITLRLDRNTARTLKQLLNQLPV